MPVGFRYLFYWPRSKHCSLVLSTIGLGPGTLTGVMEEMNGRSKERTDTQTHTEMKSWRCTNNSNLESLFCFQTAESRMQSYCIHLDKDVGVGGASDTQLEKTG